MYKFTLFGIALSFGLTACISNQYTQPISLQFQEKNLTNNKVLQVKRDGVLCSGDTSDKQTCPINFYIDNILSGTFYTNNSATYHLKPEEYNFKVKNCTNGSCQTCDVDLKTNTIENQSITLSVDTKGQPFISNNEQVLICSDQKQVPPVYVFPVESTTTIDLAADTLFKFNGSSLNDLLPKGREEILDVASQISNNFISIREVKLTGHTDHLGSDSYNQKLGQSRADTVRDLLVQNGIAGNIISTTSAGKQNPVTKGCFETLLNEELKTCLQPDRRVSVEIIGISK